MSLSTTAEELGSETVDSAAATKANRAWVLRAAACLAASDTYYTTDYRPLVRRASAKLEVLYSTVDHTSLTVALEECNGDPTVEANWVGMRKTELGAASGDPLEASQHIEKHTLAKYLSATTYGFTIPVSTASGVGYFRARIKGLGGTFNSAPKTVKVRLLEGVGV